MKTIYCLFIFLVFFIQGFGQDNEYRGLYFSSHEVNQDLRTSLNITPEKPISLKKPFILEFEASFRDGDGYYGNIVKIADDEDLNIDLVTHLHQDNSNFWLVVNDGILFQYQWKDIPNSGLFKWLKFKLEIHPESKQITLSINGKKMQTTSDHIPDNTDINIVFGKSNLVKHLTTDVCPMSLRNVMIKNHKGDVLSSWPLGKHTRTNKVFDLIGNKVAEAQNPKWLLDQHLYWQNEEELSFNNLLGTVASADGKFIYFVDKKAVYRYYTVSKEIDTLHYKGSPFECQANTFIYNPFKNEIWSYTFDHGEISTFDFETLTWSLQTSECLETSFWHHNKMISPLDSTLITFGGYGHYTYKSLLKSKSRSAAWNDYDLKDELSPRYLSSSGILNKDQFLIFGGYGSRTGDQMVNSHNFYDLHAVNFDDYRVTKIWSNQAPENTPYLPVNKMIVDTVTNAFYTLVFDNSKFDSSLRLARFGINEFDKTVYHDSISFKFIDTKSFASIFLNNDSNKLYTVTQFNNQINLNSLSYPPLKETDVIIEEKGINGLNGIIIKVLIALGLLSLLLGLFLYFLKRKRLKTSISTILPQEAKNNVSHETLKTQKHSSILLFGGFQVYAHSGEDITASFPPKLRQLLALILLFDVKNNRGIRSKKIISLLWPDKHESSARNNLNVNISKLRLLLENLKDVELVNDNTYWKINIGEEAFCDHIFSQEVLSSLPYPDLSRDHIHLFLNTLNSGEVCPDIQEGWMESLRAEITNTIIDKLQTYAKTQDTPHILIRISETILKFDNLNEEAISMKCRLLHSAGKKGLARKCYQEFCDNYKEILGTKFHLSFDETIAMSMHETF
ncbi:hypothetical protein E7Z59_13615 [Robertkochia marina]|uniref:Galactose oxidase n=1 Tax=Robertkochia marina TaxID=1227945 RepID=A0A4S3M021_9FLAO|nr:hypothetical protein [Robertkochia marina]THD66811.1 hypothetical protein E7Z59_13615 [Robertkochia marina]TRZ41898.1 hypothetical protein D3A96_12465 [Robertkochia marina]